MNNRTDFRQLPILLPEVWSIIPLDQAKGIKKRTEKKVPAGKALWSGGPWGGQTTTFRIVGNDVVENIAYAWRYTLGKAAFGYLSTGRYVRTETQIIEVSHPNGIDTIELEIARRWDWEFDDGFCASRILLPQMIPPKKSKKTKVESNQLDLFPELDDTEVIVEPEPESDPIPVPHKYADEYSDKYSDEFD